MADIDLYMVAGDTGPDRVLVVKRDGVAIDLTGSDVKLIIEDTSTKLVTNAGHQDTVIASPQTGDNKGVVTYTFEDPDVATPNVHLGQFQVTYTGGQVETDFDYIVIHVRPKAGTVS